MRICAFIFLFAITGQSFSQTIHTNLLRELDSVIAKRDEIQKAKVARINVLKESISGKNKALHYHINEAIYHEYKSFIYDSAFRYARKLYQLARELNREELIMEAKMNVSFILVSAGLFNEALDSLRSIKTSHLPDSMKASYYHLIGRTWYDLAEFNRDEFYTPLYTQRGNDYLDSALQYGQRSEIQYLISRGLRQVHHGEWHKAREDYEKLLKNFNLTNPEVAVIASTLSHIYANLGRQEESRSMVIKASIADIASSTKETVALMNLAVMLYNEGNISKGYEYIKLAMEDANFYGANQRKIQVAAVFPVIEGRQMNMIEVRKNMLSAYAIGITLFAVFLVAFGIIIYKQVKKLQAAKGIISEANEKLRETNHQLIDSNKIKEEYVTYYFSTTAEYISRLENLKKTMEMKLMTKKVDDIRFVIDSINIKRERDELYHNFDEVFLKLFPDFVMVFQSLFRDEDKIHLKDGQLLNTELRIFALIRMGISDNERISKILDYSVTTIYTYKTRVRSKSFLPNDEFDKRIMAIPTI